MLFRVDTVYDWLYDKAVVTDFGGGTFLRTRCCAVWIRRISFTTAIGAAVISPSVFLGKRALK